MNPPPPRLRRARRLRVLGIAALLVGRCSGAPPPAPAPTGARNVLVVTIDTLRADRVGAYGYGAARTPNLDALARGGTRFERAYATAPITLASHASLLTGRYPPGHGARHNGLRLDLKTPTLADAFTQAGVATAAFVAAFPLDRRFGLIKGFQTYGDSMPRDASGHLANERPGRTVVDEAIAWLGSHGKDRFLLWVHLFEPHAPYGDPSDRSQAQRPVSERYDREVTEADSQVGRLLAALPAMGVDRAQTLVVVAADHGEAFGEHGEISHSLFTYDVTLRVPLIFAGLQIPAGRVVNEPVSLVDVAPTIVAAAGLSPFDSDGTSLIRSPSSDLRPLSSARALYSESFAPLLDFGWAPLRTIRKDGWKYIAAPKAELYDLAHDPGETKNLIASESARAMEMSRQVDAISTATLAATKADDDPSVRARLQALGYASGRPGTANAPRPDPKDRRELAARIAEVASGEIQGPALERALREILRLDPENPQGNLRLGYVLMNSGRCAEAVRRFSRAIAAHIPGADAHLGLAGCQIAAKETDAARRTLSDAASSEPGNPVVQANLGLLLSDTGHPTDAIPYLQRALTIDPDLHQARFGLALAFARTNQRSDAAREAAELLHRLPGDAPQRAEVARLLAAVRPQ